MTELSLNELVSLLEQLHNAASDSRRRLRMQSPNLPLTDPRVGAARHIRACLATSYLMAIFADEQLALPAWWSERLNVTDAELIQDELIPDYMTGLTLLATREPLALFEANLRTLVRAIDPSACKSGTAEFMGSVVPWFLRRLHDSGANPILDGEEFELLDLSTAIRNTIHNNGRYLHHSGTDREITWRGTTYRFEHRKAPSFIDWQFHRLLLIALIDLNEAVMTTSLVAGLDPIP